jgi:hypothetical protein
VQNCERDEVATNLLLNEEQLSWGTQIDFAKVREGYQ